MSLLSFVYHPEDAEICVGFGSACKCFSALHKLLSRLVASSGASQPGDLLCTRQDMAAFCLYDIKVVTWRQMREKLAELGVMAITS